MPGTPCCRAAATAAAASHTGGAEGAEGLGHPADDGNRGLVIEQGAAAAIHLGIDEARGQHAARKMGDGNAGVKIGRRHDLLDPAIGNDDRQRLLKALAVEEAAALQRQAGHLVSVTFFRSRGLSGLRPRRRAMRSALP
jgi:hypothetical protein